MTTEDKLKIQYAEQTVCIIKSEPLCELICWHLDTLNMLKYATIIPANKVPPKNYMYSHTFEENIGIAKCCNCKKLHAVMKLWSCLFLIKMLHRRFLCRRVDIFWKKLLRSKKQHFLSIHHQNILMRVVLLSLDPLK